MKGGQLRGAGRAAGQLVGAVGDKGHSVEQALEGRGHWWDPAATGAARRGGRGGVVCHGIDMGPKYGNSWLSGCKGGLLSLALLVSERAMRRTKLFRPDQRPKGRGSRVKGQRWDVKGGSLLQE